MRFMLSVFLLIASAVAAAAQLPTLAEAPKLNRPQDPKKPYPYDELEVSYRNEKDNVKIAGTLTLPCATGPYPAVLLRS